MKDELMDLMHQIGMLPESEVDVSDEHIIEICRKNGIFVNTIREPMMTTITVRDMTNGNQIREQYTIVHEKSLKYGNIIYKDFVIQNLLVQIIALRYNL